MLTLLESSKKAATHVMQAIEHNSKHQYNLAILELNSAITLSPKNFDALLLRGKLLLQQEKYTRALEDFNNTTKINRENVEGWHYKGIALYVLKKYDLALKAFDHAIECDASSALLHMHKANTLGVMCRIDEAIRSYNTALKLDPKNALINFNKGFLLYLANMISEALIYFELAVLLDDQDSCAHMFLGSTLAQNNLEVQALEHYETGFKLNAKYPWHNYYPCCKDRYENFYSDMHSFLNSKQEEFFFKMHAKVTALIGLSLYEKAYEMNEVVNETAEDEMYSALSHCVKGGILWKTNKYVEALKEIEKAEILDSEVADELGVIKGRVLYCLERFQDAAKECEKPKSNYSNDAAFYQTYSQVLYKLHNFKEAEVAINSAIRIDDYPDSKSYLYKGDILSALGKYKESIIQYNKALKENMFEEDARKGVVDALMKLKQFAKALQYMKDFYNHHSILRINIMDISPIYEENSPWYLKIILRIRAKGADVIRKMLVNLSLTSLLLKKHYMHLIEIKTGIGSLYSSNYLPQFHTNVKHPKKNKKYNAKAVFKSTKQK